MSPTQRLVRRDICIGLTQGAHRYYDHLSTYAVGQLLRRPHVVKEQRVAGTVRLAYRSAQFLDVCLVVLAELRELLTASLLAALPILLKKQHERRAVAPQFPVNAPEFGLDSTSFVMGVAKQPAP